MGGGGELNLIDSEVGFMSKREWKIDGVEKKLMIYRINKFISSILGTFHYLLLRLKNY